MRTRRPRLSNKPSLRHELRSKLACRLICRAEQVGEEQSALSPLCGKDLLREVAITAANNLAVCALHRGTIFEAVAQIEAAVQENPQVFLHPQIVHNLKILYVVSLKPAAATAKNALIARLVELYHEPR